MTDISKLEPVAYKEIGSDSNFRFWDFFKPVGANPAHVVVSPEAYKNGDGTDVPCWCGEYHDKTETPNERTD